MQEGRPRESLVLHDTPIEIGPGADPNDPFKKSFGTSKRKGNLPPMENRPKQEDILNAILPPREWVEGGKSTLISFVTSTILRFEFFDGLYLRDCRQALDPVCQSSASQQNRRRPSQRNARPKADGKTSKREWHLPRQRRALLPVL